MLRLTGLTVHNICQFDDMSCDISAGLTSITGPNGRGKSSLLRALVYALTGIVDGDYGNQSMLQKDGTADPGWAEAKFTDGTSTYAVRRYSTSDVKLYDRLDKDGDRLAIRRKAVDAALTELYGITPALLFQTCWCRQGRLDYMLTATPAVVNSYLQNVFDMRGLERLREKIKLAADTIATYPPAVIEQARQRAEALAALPAHGSYDNAIAQATADVDRLSAAKTDLESRCAVGISSEAYDRELEARIENINRLDEWLTTNPEYEEPEDVDTTVAAIDAELVSLEREYNEQRALAEHHSSQAEQQTSRAENDRAAAAKCRAKLASVEARLSATDDVCHLCGGQIVDHANYERTRAQLVCGMNSLEEYREHEQREIERYESSAAACELGASQSHESECKATAAMTAAYDKAAQLQAVRDKAACHEQWVENERMRAETQVNRDKGYAALEQFMKTPVYPSDVEQQLVRVRSDLDEASVRLQRLTDERTQTETARAMLTEYVSQDGDVQAKATINTNARDTLMELREIFSQQRAQAVYLRSRIRALNQRIERFMTAVQMPFSLALNPDTHLFEQTSQEGFVHPASHLSGAQKSMAACVLQMSLMSVVQPNINLFLLDEPGEALDENNKVLMAELFGRMARMMPTIEGTMLLVTRDRHLIDACQNNIDVGAADAGSLS